MTQLLDNKGQGKVGDALVSNIKADARLSIISGCFSIYGYALLKEQLKQVDALRLLIPDYRSRPVSKTGSTFNVPGLTGNEVDRRFRNSLNLIEIARECADWLRQKAEIKAVTSTVPSNLFHIQNPEGDSHAIHGSSSSFQH